MFKNFFKKHVSIVTVNEEVLGIISDTLENGMKLSIPQLGQYTEEDFVLIGKRNFNLVGLITDETFAKLGQLIVQMEKYNTTDLKLDTFEKFLDILNITEYTINPKNLTSNLVYLNGYKLSSNTLTNLADDFDYENYDELMSKAEMFINYKVKEINTVLKYFTNEQIIEIIQKGLFRFSPYKYILLNFEAVTAGSVSDLKATKTYLIGVNTYEEVYVGYVAADGRTLSKNDYAELSYILALDNTTNDFDLPTETDAKLYLGFFTFYTKKEIVLNNDTIFPNYTNYLIKQKHNLSSLIVETDADTTYTINTALPSYKLKKYINKSDNIIFNLIPSLLIEYIDISENGLTGTPLDTCMDWFIDRNVFNTVLIVNGTQVITFDYETLMSKLNWDITFIGILAGTYTVGTVKYLPKNTTPYWLMCLGQTLDVAVFPLLWYNIRDTYGSENINNGDYDVATFKLPLGTNKYIYYGDNDDYDAVTELDFSNDAVSGLYFSNEFFAMFPNLVDFILGEYSELNKIDIMSNDFNILDITGDDTILNYQVEPVAGAFSLTELRVGGNNTTVTSPFFTSGTVLQSFHRMLKFIPNLTLYEIKNITLSNSNTLPTLAMVLPANTTYTAVTTFKLTRVILTQTTNNLTAELLNKLKITNVEFLSVEFNSPITIGKSNSDTIIRKIDIEYLEGGTLNINNCTAINDFSIINTVLNTLALSNLGNNVTYNIENTDISTLTTANNVYGTFNLDEVNINTVLKLDRFYNSAVPFDLSRVYFSPNATIEILFMNVRPDYIHTTSNVDTLKLSCNIPIGSAVVTPITLNLNNKIAKHITIYNLRLVALTNLIKSEVITLKFQSNSTTLTSLDLTGYSNLQSLQLWFEDMTNLTLPAQAILSELFFLGLTGLTTLDISQTPNLTSLYLDCPLTITNANSILINLDTFNNSEGLITLPYTDYNDLSTAAQTAVANLQIKEWVITLA
jgi:hypothetical protein